MYIDIYWWESLDPDTGLPVTKGGRYTNITNLSFSPQTDMTGNSLPINEYTVDIITTDEIPVEAIGHELYDDRNFIWAEWPFRKIQRIAPNCLRVTASSWLYLLDYRQLEAKMYTGQTAEAAIAECFGDRVNDYTISAAIRGKTISGFAPAQNARERLTWLCFVLGAYAYDMFRGNVAVTAVDEADILVPMDCTFMRPVVDNADWVTGIKITAYNFARGTKEEYENDDNSYMFPAPWIATPQTFTLSNPDAPDDVPENIVEIDGIYLINPTNVSEIAARLAKYWFNPKTITLDCVNNRKYKPGDLVTVYVDENTMFTGYIQQESFQFGHQARSTLKLVGAELRPSDMLTINYVCNNRRIGRAKYRLPVDYEYSIENLYLDITNNEHRRVYRPLTDFVIGTMVEGGVSVDVEYEIALDLYKGVLHIISVDKVTQQETSGKQIGVIA